MQREFQETLEYLTKDPNHLIRPDTLTDDDLFELSTILHLAVTASSSVHKASPSMMRAFVRAIFSAKVDSWTGMGLLNTLSPLEKLPYCHPEEQDNSGYRLFEFGANGNDDIHTSKLKCS